MVNRQIAVRGGIHMKKDVAKREGISYERVRRIADIVSGVGLAVLIVVVTIATVF